MLNITHPPGCSSERDWIYRVLFGEFLGIEYTAREGQVDHIRIENDGHVLELADTFFSLSKNQWLKPESHPTQPLTIWDTRQLPWRINLVSSDLPIIYGHESHEISEDCVRFGLDFFGSAFFMLSRYEELALLDRDNHNRFPATASLAYKAKFLDRPIIDEYVEVLWTAMKHLWPNIHRKTRQGDIRVTCDVDVPFDCTASCVRRLVRSLTGDVLKRRDGRLFSSRIRNYRASKKGDYSHDPYHTFDWYMDACENAGRLASFYFITDHSGGSIDGCYDIKEQKILELIRRIDRRGHEIGVHGSYNSYQSASQIQLERQRLINACRQVGVDDHVNGNRQHYLRWDTSQTPDYLNAAGYVYDTTGSFADLPGFRYGTSRPFTMWSWQKYAQLQIKQVPLILMECSIISERYMGLGYTEESMTIMKKLKQRALAYGGNFTLLWHNSHLTTQEDKAFFTELVL